MLKHILNFWLDKAHWFALLSTIFIISVSLTNSDSLGQTQTIVSDKILHTIGYMVLMWSWLIFFKQRKISNRKFTLLIVLSLFGIIIELLQGYITVSRTPDWRDAVANIIGLSIGLLSFNILFSRYISIKES
jgi:VanZ family protein